MKWDRDVEVDFKGDRGEYEQNILDDILKESIKYYLKNIV